MRKRVPLLAAAALAVCGLTWLLVWLSGPAVSPRNFERIRSGMSQAQVEAILGPGQAGLTAPAKWQDRVGVPIQYAGEEYAILVWYDQDGRVASTAEFIWIYRWKWDVPLRVKVRRALGLHPRLSSD